MIKRSDKKRKAFKAAKKEVLVAVDASSTIDLPITTTQSALKGIKKMTVLERRAELASLLPRGYSHAELALQLKKRGFCDSSSRPLPESIIKADIEAIERYWKEVCAEGMEKHRARQLMELTRLKTAAYDESDLELVLKVLSKEIDLLGTKVAVKESNNATTGTTIFDFRSQAISIDKRDQLALDVLNAARKRAGQPDNADQNTVDTTTKAEGSV